MTCLENTRQTILRTPQIQALMPTQTLFIRQTSTFTRKAQARLQLILRTVWRECR